MLKIKARPKLDYILHSGLECLRCGVSIVSFNRHDFVECLCKRYKLFVDGGFDYFRCGTRLESIDRPASFKRIKLKLRRRDV